MSKSELAQAYGVTRITFMSWLKPFKDQIGDTGRSKLLTPKQVAVIFEVLGRP